MHPSTQAVISSFQQLLKQSAVSKIQLQKKYYQRSFDLIMILRVTQQNDPQNSLFINHVIGKENLLESNKSWVLLGRMDSNQVQFGERFSASISPLFNKRWWSNPRWSIFPIFEHFNWSWDPKNYFTNNTKTIQALLQESERLYMATRAWYMVNMIWSMVLILTWQLVNCFCGDIMMIKNCVSGW